jgi:hypothetical protein
MRAKKQGWTVSLVILALVLFGLGAKDKTTQAPSTLQQVSVAPSYVSSSANAPTPEFDKSQAKYIDADRLNVRSAPRGKVVSSLKRGTPVQIYEELTGWSRISARAEAARWVSSDSLCGAYDCWVRRSPAGTLSTPGTTRPYTPSTQRSTPSSYSSSCPCSSGSVCIGPRGGRYCITSGGNKRYGI